MYSFYRFRWDIDSGFDDFYGIRVGDIFVFLFFKYLLDNM